MTWKRFLFGFAVVTIVIFGLMVRATLKAVIESPQQSVMVEADWLLMIYYQQHGRYPDSLDALEFKFGGDGDASTLAKFEYRTDGKYYRIVTKSAWDGSEMSSCYGDNVRMNASTAP